MQEGLILKSRNRRKMTVISIKRPSGVLLYYYLTFLSTSLEPKRAQWWRWKSEAGGAQGHDLGGFPETLLSFPALDETLPHKGLLGFRQPHALTV